MYYAGIGSRETPGNILYTMQNLASFLSKENYILRSGHAKGADKAFEKGELYGHKEIFVAEDSDENPHWFDHAKKYHPAWSRCSHWAKRLHARNSAILLGKDLNSPVDFVICWTAKGQRVGGTAQGLRIADDEGIVIHNLYFDPKGKGFLEWFKTWQDA